MRASMYTSMNPANDSTIIGNNHWYDEFARTFVIRRFTNDTVDFGELVVQTKLDYDSNTYSSDVQADWKLTVAKKVSGTPYTIFDKAIVNDADFRISTKTTQER